MQRSLLIFENSIKSESTRQNYKKHMERFLKFTKIKDYDGLTKVAPEQMQTIIEDYTMHLKKEVAANSIPTYMTGVKHFFIMNRIPIYWEIIQKFYPEKTKRSGQKGWEDWHIQKMAEYSNSARNKALVHFMASTGARKGVHDYPLQMRHLKDMGDGCKAVLIYAGNPDEYWAFLTPEATKYLQEYFDQRELDHEKFYPETPIFRNVYRLGMQKPTQVNGEASRLIIERLVKTAKIQRIKVNRRNHDIHLEHGFRKRFNIILKLENDVNSNIAEKIMGHSVSIPLDGTYLPATDERVIQKCFTEFKKAIPQLTVSDSARQKAKLDIVTKEKTELERSNVLNKSLQTQIDEIKKSLAEEFKKKYGN